MPRIQRLAKTAEHMVSTAYLGVMAGADQNVHLDSYPALGLPRPLLKPGQLSAQNLEGLIDMQPMQIQKNDTCRAAAGVKSIHRRGHAAFTLGVYRALQHAEHRSAGVDMGQPPCTAGVNIDWQHAQHEQLNAQVDVKPATKIDDMGQHSHAVCVAHMTCFPPKRL